MHPELLRIGDVVIPSAGALMGAGVIVASLLASRDTHRLEPAKRVSPVVGVWAYLGALLGGRLAFALLEGGAVWAVARNLLLGEAGSTSWGSLLGAGLGAAAYLRWARVALSFAETLDFGAPYLCLVEAFTRVGCLLNGCCWGTRCDRAWGVAFPRDSFAFGGQVRDRLIGADAGASLPVHPVQLYTAAAMLAAFVGLRVLWRKGARPGTVILCFLVAYGVLRLGLETFRADVEAFAWGLTLAQWGGAGFVVAGTAGLIWMRRTGT